MTKSLNAKKNQKSNERAESYEVLLNDIATLYEEKVGMGIRQRNEQLVVSYWEIGDRIVSGEKSAGIKARYGKKLIPQLSADLTARFGSGFGETNIFEIRRFRLEYSRKDLHPLLTWAHYRALISVRDATRREELEARTIAERLSFKKLKALARLTNGMSIAENRKDLLTPRKGRPYLYKVVSETLNGKKSVLLDCGFQVKRKVKLNGVRQPGDGELLRCAKTDDAGYHFSRVTGCEAGERYCYNGTVLDVVDGDTLVVRVNLGFDTFIDDRFRLRGVDAPELNTDEGNRARQFVQRRIKPGSPALLLTYGCDMYGRYLADVFYSGPQSAERPTVESGRFLNVEILEKGIAGFWDAMRWE